jgi:hypothetical protein
MIEQIAYIKLEVDSLIHYQDMFMQYYTFQSPSLELHLLEISYFVY